MDCLSRGDAIYDDGLIFNEVIISFSQADLVKDLMRVGTWFGSGPSGPVWGPRHALAWPGCCYGSPVFMVSSEAEAVLLGSWVVHYFPNVGEYSVATDTSCG